MRITANARINYVWIALSAITILSWGLATAREGTDLVSSVPITIGVLTLGLVKVRLIMQEFMEVRTAPRWLRRFTDIWLVTFWVAVLAIYLY
jgi:hypothetical protein